MGFPASVREGVLAMSQVSIPNRDLWVFRLDYLCGWHWQTESFNP